MLLCVLTLAVSVSPSFAQKGGITSMGMYRKAGKFPERVYGSTVNSNSTATEEMCFPWAISTARATTVSVNRLKVPQKAMDEFQKACDASNGGKLAEAEQHARGAIGKFQNYPAGWVLLGLVLEDKRNHKKPATPVLMHR